MAVKKAKKIKKTVPEGRAYVHAGMNNTIVTITDEKGGVLARSSSGSNGFKGTKKSTPYAAQIAAESVVEKCKPFGVEVVDVYVKGIGPGREQAIRGLISGGFNINVIVDRTPVPHNGCRKKRARRV
jgi:small subunit ribosomal protein S11